MKATRGIILPADVRDRLHRDCRHQYATQRNLARAVGISEKHLSQVLSGRQGVSLELAGRITAALGLELAFTVRKRRR